MVSTPDLPGADGGSRPMVGRDPIAARRGGPLNFRPGTPDTGRVYPAAALIPGADEAFQIAARGDVEFGEAPGEVGLHGFRAEVEAPGDLLVRPALADQERDVLLPLGQALERVRAVLHHDPQRRGALAGEAAVGVGGDHDEAPPAGGRSPRPGWRRTRIIQRMASAPVTANAATGAECAILTATGAGGAEGRRGLCRAHGRAAGPARRR